MRFAYPQALWALLLVPVAVAAVFAARAARRRALARFAGGPAYLARFQSAVSENRRAIKAVCLIAAVAAGVLAFARPQGAHGTELLVRKGIDVVVLIDTSRSMAAQDVAPDRLARGVREAKLVLRKLTGDRVALVAFAGAPALLCPLTLDHGAVDLLLDALDVQTVSVPGTALGDAMREAARALGPPPAVGEESRSRAILVISDGEDHEGGVDEALAAAKRAGAAVFAVGVGTAEGAPVPMAGSGAYEKAKDGTLITTRLDETPLRRLAVDTGGRYYRATPGEAEVPTIAKALDSLDASGSGTVLRTRWEERYQIPLGFALAALLVDAALTDRRRTR